MFASASTRSTPFSRRTSRLRRRRPGRLLVASSAAATASVATTAASTAPPPRAPPLPIGTVRPARRQGGRPHAAAHGRRAQRRRPPRSAARVAGVRRARRSAPRGRPSAAPHAVAALVAADHPARHAAPNHIPPPPPPRRASSSARPGAPPAAAARSPPSGPASADVRVRVARHSLGLGGGRSAWSSRGRGRRWPTRTAASKQRMGWMPTIADEAESARARGATRRRPSRSRYLCSGQAAIKSVQLVTFSGSPPPFARADARRAQTREVLRGLAAAASPATRARSAIIQMGAAWRAEPEQRAPQTAATRRTRLASADVSELPEHRRLEGRANDPPLRSPGAPPPLCCSAAKGPRAVDPRAPRPRACRAARSWLGDLPRRSRDCARDHWYGVRR